MATDLIWKGDEVYQIVKDSVVSGLNEFGARWETAAKGGVYPGRGVVTGTYRRSLHFSHVGYNFGNDNVRPSARSRERGGTGKGAKFSGDTASILMGSGMAYAMRLEKMYNVVMGAFDATEGMLLDILRKHATRNGLKPD